MRVFNTYGELLVLDANAAISDVAYDATSWNGVTDKAASKNALRDKVEALIDDTAYGAGWNGVTDVAPSKNAVYDKIEAIGGVVFTDYRYYTDLAAAATYTPPAKAMATLFCEGVGMADDRIHMEFYDGAGWIAAFSATMYQDTCSVFQDNNQNLRVVNGAGSAHKISLTGVTWA